MKFVFDKNPVNVAKQMKEFKYEIEAALAEPLTLNVYDNEFYSKVDGSLDFGRTSSCFQVCDYVIQVILICIIIFLSRS